MKILLVGNGGREHALGWALARDERVRDLFFAPGNAGTLALGTNLPLKATDLNGIMAWCREERPDLVVVGPEAPLCLGLVDRLHAEAIPAFGPDRECAQLEGSKIFAKDLLIESGIPTARSARFSESEPACAYLDAMAGPVVIKADGLAAGKGVIIAETRSEAEGTIREMLDEGAFGEAGRSILIEEFLDGQEASIHAVTDGQDYVLFPSSQDHKRVGDGDTGPNTGGMGAYAPAPVVTPDLLREVESTVFQPLLNGLRQRGLCYRGVLYGGLMLTSSGPKVLEFNCRFGDPETQVILPLLETPLLDVIMASIHGGIGSLDLSFRKGSTMTVVLASKGYPTSPRIGDPITGLDQVTDPNQIVFHAGTHRENGQITSSGGRVLSVTGWGEGLEQARDEAYRGLCSLHLEGGHFRRDIGHRALIQEGHTP